MQFFRNQTRLNQKWSVLNNITRWMARWLTRCDLMTRNLSSFLLIATVTLSVALFDDFSILNALNWIKLHNIFQWLWFLHHCSRIKKGTMREQRVHEFEKKMHSFDLCTLMNSFCFIQYSADISWYDAIQAITKYRIKFPCFIVHFNLLSKMTDFHSIITNFNVDFSIFFWKIKKWL